MADENRLIDAQHYRQVLGQYPTGVCVVTSTSADAAPAGMVVGSFTSVSLDPPLIGFFPDRGSSSWPKVAAAGRFCVNILSADQEGICRKLASKDPDKFATIAHRPSPLGSPILDGAVAWIDCELHSVGDAGDHFAVLGLIRQLEISNGGLPLLFFQGGYGRFAPSSLTAPDPTGLLSATLRLVDRSRHDMEALASKMSAVCIASARVQNEIVILASAGQPRGDLPATLVGQRLPFFPSTGAVFGAWLDHAEIDRWVAGGRSAVRAADVVASLDVVRQRGYSLGLASEARRAFAERLGQLADDGPSVANADLADLVVGLEYEPLSLDDASARAVRIISAPVFDASGCVAFALTIHDFERPASRADVERLAGQLLQTTQSAGAALGAPAQKEGT